ncbi:MAG: hypothetical protein ACRYG7_36470 [Janthinobacterium lividum]
MNRAITCLKTSFLALSLGATTHNVQAQQASPITIRLSPEDQARRQYGAQHNFYFLPPGKTGENYQNAGFFGGKLRPYLAGNSEALRELDQYKRQKIFYLIDKGLLVSAAGLYSSQVFSHGDPVYFNTAQQAAAGVAAISLLATIFINRHTNEHLKQAVDDYNSDLPTAHGGAWPRLRPASVGMAALYGRPGLALRWQL